VAAAGFHGKLFVPMSPFLQLAIELVVILLAAKAAGYLSTRLGQPSVLGEILVGILLGPSLLDIIHLPFVRSENLAETLQTLGELGVLLLMFLAGLELHLGELTSHRRVSILASLGGLFLTLGLGWGSGRLFGLSNSGALLLGLALSATSVSIAARTLMELKILRSRMGLSLLGAAVVDDVLSLLALSVFLAFQTPDNGFANLLWIAIRMLIFFALAAAFGLWILPWLARGIGKLGISQGALTLAIITLLVYGLAAELVGGMAAIIGAFLAGLMFARTPEKSVIEHGMNSLAYGLFVPIFFISIGLSVNLRILPVNAILLILAVTLISILGKLVGAAGGARLGGLPLRESIQLGAGMVARGEVTLIIAAVGIRAGMLGEQAFSAIVAAVLFCTLLTPLLLRASFPAPKHEVLSKESEA
jgi:Kef-type K+ transport system membrane component KefB